MTIDVSKLKEGDDVLVEMKVMMNDTKNEKIFFSDDAYYHRLFTYRQLDGKIKEILPAPFDWKDAKPGMAFRFLNGDITYYSGPDPLNKKYVICVIGGISLSAAYRMSELSRAPEHDIEVPE